MADLILFLTLVSLRSLSEVEMTVDNSLSFFGGRSLSKAEMTVNNTLFFFWKKGTSTTSTGSVAKAQCPEMVISTSLNDRGQFLILLLRFLWSSKENEEVSYCSLSLNKTNSSPFLNASF